MIFKAVLRSGPGDLNWPWTFFKGTSGCANLSGGCTGEKPLLLVPAHSKLRTLTPSPATHPALDGDGCGAHLFVRGWLRVKSSALGLDPDHRPSTPGASDAGVGGALQPSPTTSEPGPQNADCQVGSGRRDHSRALLVATRRAAAPVFRRAGRGGCLIFVQTNMCASQGSSTTPWSPVT